jgi:hypothetical protein
MYDLLKPTISYEEYLEMLERWKAELEKVAPGSFKRLDILVNRVNNFGMFLLATSVISTLGLLLNTRCPK